MNARFLSRSLFAAIAWAPVLALLLGALGPESPGPPLWGRLAARMRESLLLAGGAALLSLPPGALTAWLLARRRFRGRALLIFLTLAPLFIPPYVAAIAATRIAGAQGWATRLALGPRAEELPLGAVAPARPEDSARPARETPANAPLAARPAPVYSRGGVIAVLLFCFWPLTALGGWLALSFGDPALEDWARLHTGPAQVALRVTLPLAAPGLFAGAAAVFLFSLAEFGAPEALRAHPTLSVEVYAQIGVHYAPRAGALAGLLLAGGGLLFAGLAWALWRAVFPGGAAALALGPEARLYAPAPVRRRDSARWALAAVWALVAPPAAAVLLTLLWSSFETASGGGVQAWKSALRGGWDEWLYGAGLGAGAAALCVALGGLMTSASGRRKKRAANFGSAALNSLSRGRFSTIWRAFGGFLLLAPVILPGPVSASGWSAALSHLAGWGAAPGAPWFAIAAGGAAAFLLDTPGALWLAWMGRWTPLAFLFLAAARARIPEEWREAARLEGASGPRAWMAAEGPALLRAAMAAALLIWSLSLAEVGAALLLTPPGFTPLGVRLMSLMHYAPTAEVCALALLNAALGGIALAGMFAMRRIFPAAAGSD